MPYVDGYVIPIKKKQVPAYKRIALKAGKIWRECGALEFRECVADDLNTNMGITFPKLTKLKPGETVLFSWIVFKSKADRNKVNAKVFKDARMQKIIKLAMVFDVKRMSYGGFTTIVNL